MSPFHTGTMFIFFKGLAQDFPQTFKISCKSAFL